MKAILAFLLAISIAGCDRGVDVPPTYAGLLLTQANVDSVLIAFTTYDKVILTHQAGSILKSRQFSRIEIGLPDSSGFRELYSSVATFDPEFELYSLEFNFSATLDSSKAETRFVVRYHLASSGIVETSVLVQQYKYPYSRSEIFLNNNVLTDISYENRYQDFDRIGDKLFFHPTGSQGLFENNLATGSSRYLLPYTSGDCIAADSVFVFCDVGHNTIRRYNLALDVDESVIVSFPREYSIRGIDADRGILYVIVDGPTHRFRRYSYDGALLDSALLSLSHFHLTVSNGIAYTTDFYQTIHRFDIPTMTLLPNLKGPARNLEGIRIINGQFYYCDYFKKVVCSLPVQDLN